MARVIAEDASFGGGETTRVLSPISIAWAKRPAATE
jgi:hypothetical protein